MKIELKLTKSKKMYQKAFDIYQSMNKDNGNFDKFYAKWKIQKLYLIKIENNVFVGYVLITERNEIGYFVLPEHRNKNIATKAIKQLMMNNKRKYYWALIDFPNIKSLHFIQKLGFIPKSLVYVKSSDID